jgi:hypothetical protein
VKSPEGARELLTFGRAIATQVAPISGEPLVYGSLAFVAHTGDWALGIADIDFLVPDAVLPGVLETCRRDAGLVCEATDYHTVKVRRGDLKLSFDSLDHYLAGIAHRPEAATIGGFPFQVIDQPALIAAYERAAETIPIKRAAYLAKLEALRAPPRH